MPTEVEIKALISDPEKFRRRLTEVGFTLLTPRTHEMNTLYDFRDGALRARGEIVRIRKYGNLYTLTHKAKSIPGRHKMRMETETRVDDGEALAAIFHSLGLHPSFRYEKFREEWSDAAGHVVVDETPIGNVAELEGPSEWIDRVAAKLGIANSDYITLSYAQLFASWCSRTGSKAREMTWESLRASTG